MVYSFTCQCCSSLYALQTARHLLTRVSDHLGICPLTGMKRTSPSPSSILSHLSETGHSASLNDFRILSSCSSSSELLAKESLPIRKLNPSLNTNLCSIPLSVLIDLFIFAMCPISYLVFTFILVSLIVI